MPVPMLSTVTAAIHSACLVEMPLRNSKLSCSGITISVYNDTNSRVFFPSAMKNKRIEKRICETTDIVS